MDCHSANRVRHVASAVKRQPHPAHQSASGSAYCADGRAEVKVRITKPQIVIERDWSVKDAVSFLPARVIPAQYVNARIIRTKTLKTKENQAND